MKWWWYGIKFTLGCDFLNLKDGNFKVTESLAIMRYLCAKHGLKLLDTTIKETTYADIMLLMISTYKIRIVYEKNTEKIHPSTFDRLKEKVKVLTEALVIRSICQEIN